jgi:uncharacterized coiled-coil DUF342 family protein
MNQKDIIQWVDNTLNEDEATGTIELGVNEAIGLAKALDTAWSEQHALKGKIAELHALADTLRAQRDQRLDELQQLQAIRAKANRRKARRIAAAMVASDEV